MLFETTTSTKPAKKKVKRKVNQTVYELLNAGAWLEPYLPDNYLKAFKLYRKRRILVRYVTAGDFRRLLNDGVLLETASEFRISRKRILELRKNNIIRITYQAFLEDERRKRALHPCSCPALIPVNSSITKPRKK